MSRDREDPCADVAACVDPCGDGEEGHTRHDGQEQNEPDGRR